MREILNVFETRIEFDETICLKDMDINELKKWIQKLTATIADACQTELNLRMKEREELALKSEYNCIKHKFDIVHREREHLDK